MLQGVDFPGDASLPLAHLPPGNILCAMQPCRQLQHAPLLRRDLEAERLNIGRTAERQQKIMHRRVAFAVQQAGRQRGQTVAGRQHKQTHRECRTGPGQQGVIQCLPCLDSEHLFQQLQLGLLRLQHLQMLHQRLGSLRPVVQPDKGAVKHTVRHTRNRRGLQLARRPVRVITARKAVVFRQAFLQIGQADARAGLAVSLQLDAAGTRQRLDRHRQ